MNVTSDDHAIRELARQVVRAGPFYGGIDDDFCAVCDACFLDVQDHREDCAYIALCRLLGEDPEGQWAE